MCSLHLQTREIIGRGHHISVYRIHVKLPYLSPWPLALFSHFLSVVIDSFYKYYFYSYSRNLNDKKIKNK